MSDITEQLDETNPFFEIDNQMAEFNESELDLTPDEALELNVEQPVVETPLLDSLHVVFGYGHYSPTFDNALDMLNDKSLYDISELEVKARFEMERYDKPITLEVIAIRKAIEALETLLTFEPFPTVNPMVDLLKDKVALLNEEYFTMKRAVERLLKFDTTQVYLKLEEDKAQLKKEWALKFPNSKID